MTDQYNISISAALVFIFGGNKEQWSTHFVKRGEMTLSRAQRQLAEERVDIFESIRPYTNRKGLTPRSFLQAINTIHEKGQAKKVIEGIQRSGKMFTPSTIYKDNIDLFSRRMA